MPIPLVVAAFEAACLASDAVMLAGLDAVAVQAIRVALARFAPALASDVFIPSTAAATAGAGALVASGRVTTAGAEFVVRRLARLLQESPQLQQEFNQARRLGAHFLPVVDDGLCLACSFVYKGTPRRFSMRIGPGTDVNQFRLFLKTCNDGLRGKFYNPSAQWYRYYNWR
jgi:hypothetical protein